MGNSTFGPASIFILIAAFALIFFLVLANAFDFKDELFSYVFPKEQSFAQTDPVSQAFEFNNIKVDSVTGESAIISWNTNHLGTSKVLFGQFENVLSLMTRENDQLTTSHQETISGLQPGTKYYFQVVSRTSDGQVSSSKVGEFNTK